ncbi:MAG: sigma factor-like helix-turn-helix DNA-binding protein [Bacillota bacterium]
MGASNYDKEAGDRRYEAQYPALNSSGGLRILLGDYHALKSRQYMGDYDATAILIDLATAVELAGLTNRQRQALALVYGEDLTQVEAGKRMGVRQDVVSEHIDKAVEAIAEVYWYWSGHGEGYTMTEGESA